MKTADFKIRTRNRQLPAPTRLADRIFATALPLLEKELDGTRFRLLGVGVHELDAPDKADPPDLIDTVATRRAKAEEAIDALREKYGKKAVETGYTFGRESRFEPQQPSDREDDF
jgi:DNA polymerase-4